MSAGHEPLQQFGVYLRQSGLAENTIEAYCYDVENFFDWLSTRSDRGSKATFSAAAVEAYKLYLREDRSYSPASINRCLQSLRKFGRFWSRHQGVNPVEDVALVAAPDPAPPQTLSGDQVTRLLRVARQRQARTAARDEAMLHLLLHTGIRARELVRLRCRHLVWADEESSIRVPAGPDETPARRLPLSPDSRRALRRYLDQAQPAPNAYLFAGRDDAPLSVRSVQQVVSKLGQAADLNVSVSLLRDTYARCLWEETGDLRLLSQRMGYKHLSTGLRHIVGGATLLVSHWLLNLPH